MFRFRVAATLLVIGVASMTYAASLQVVGQKGRLFHPGTLSVKAGSPLAFQNDDDVTHHIYSSTKGQEFDLDTIAPGKSENFTFTKPGRVDVRCGLHPGMRLVVNVE
jgi:plastocyanin